MAFAVAYGYHLKSQAYEGFLGTGFRYGHVEGVAHLLLEAVGHAPFALEGVVAVQGVFYGKNAYDHGGPALSGLGAIVGVAGDVVVGKVGSQQAGFAGAVAHDHVEGKIHPLERFFEKGVEVEVGGAAFAEEFHAAQGHAQGHGVEIHTGAAGGGHNAAPVGVAAEHGGFHELAWKLFFW